MLIVSVEVTGRIREITNAGIQKPIKKDKNKGHVPIFSWRDEKTLEEHITNYLLEKEEPAKSYINRITIEIGAMPLLYSQAMMGS